MARVGGLCQYRHMPEPDQRLFFLLQKAAHRLRVVADRRCLAAGGITTAQLGALFGVHDRPGITQQQLADVLGSREPAVAGLVGRLVSAGLIAKKAQPDEHRAAHLELTAAGAAALRSVLPEIERFNAELRAVLGAGGFDQTAVAMRKLAHWESETDD
jgi:DNA-binding MarR family transcriptional regulator